MRAARLLLITLFLGGLVAAAVWAVTAIYQTSAVPDYAAEPIENRVLLLTTEPGRGLTLEATISDRGADTEYSVGGLDSGATWLLLLGDARLVGVPDHIVVADGHYPSVAGPVAYQLRVPTRVRSSDVAMVEGQLVVEPEEGASRWEFASPSLDVSCTGGDSLNLELITADLERASDVLHACGSYVAKSLAVNIQIDSDERLDSDSDAAREPAVDRQRFISRHTDELAGFPFGVSSAIDAAASARNAALAGVVLGAVAALLGQWFYDCVLRPCRSPRAQPVATGGIPEANHGGPTGWLGTVAALLLFLLAASVHGRRERSRRQR